MVIEDDSGAANKIVVPKYYCHLLIIKLMVPLLMVVPRQPEMKRYHLPLRLVKAQVQRKEQNHLRLLLM